MKQNLFLDMETCPDYSRSDLWLAGKEFTSATGEENEYQAWLNAQMKAMALQPEACMIVGLNVALGDGECKSGWVGEPSPTGDIYDEAALLRLFWSWAASAPRIVGFNILKFDLPVIYTRSALLGVAPTRAFYDAKPWQNEIIDLMARRFQYQSKDQYMSLKALRRVLQLEVPEKYQEIFDNTGADVEELYLRFLAGGEDAGEALRLLKLYGECDVWSTRALARLWSGFFFPVIE